MRKLISLLVVLMLVSGVAVFAGGSKEEKTAETGETKVTVTIWGWRAQDKPVWEKVQAALQGNGENIEIVYTVIKPTEYDSKVALSLQGGTGPDIFLTRRLPGPRTQSLIDAGYLQNLDGIVDFSHFTETTLSFIQSGGKTWGVPFANQIVGIFYNKDIFDKYGLKEPRSWDELLDICKTLKSNGVTPFMIPGKSAWALAMQHAMTGVSVLGEKWIGELIEGKRKFTDPEFVDLNRRLNDLKVYYQKDFMANDTTDMSAGFAMGQAAMVFYGIWGGTRWKELNPDFHYGYFPVPPKTTNDKAYVYVYMDGSYGLNKASKNKDAAIKILKFTATPEYGKIFSATTGEMTAVKGAELPKDNPILLEGYKYANTIASKNIYWVGSPFQKGNPTVYAILREGMQAMYLDKITPEELAKRVQDGVSTWYKPLMGK